MLGGVGMVGIHQARQSETQEQARDSRFSETVTTLRCGNTFPVNRQELAKEFLSLATKTGIPELRVQRNLAWISNWRETVIRLVGVVSINKQCCPARGLFRQQMADAGVHMIDWHCFL